MRGSLLALDDGEGGIDVAHIVPVGDAVEVAEHRVQQEQRAAIVGSLVDPAPRPGAEQAVAAAKMVIQEALRP